MHVNLTDQGKQDIQSVIKQVFLAVMYRCEKSGATEAEFSSSAYGIQDYLGSIDCDGTGLSFPDEEKVVIPSASYWNRELDAKLSEQEEIDIQKQEEMDIRCIKTHHYEREVDYCINPNCPSKNAGAWSSLIQWAPLVKNMP
jgi:hypothetical protein